jgi:predicted nucleic acid-binding Zn ribbon protein
LFNGKIDRITNKCNKISSVVVSPFRSFPHSWLITGFVTRLTRRVPLVEQELLTRQEPPHFSGVRVAQSLGLRVYVVDRCLSFCSFVFWSLCCLFFFDIRILITSLFGHCVVCSSSIYGFWLPLCLAIVLSVLLRYTDSDYLFVWSLCCLFFFDIRILITSLFGHCVVCSSSIYGFWLPLWYPQALLPCIYFLLWW